MIKFPMTSPRKVRWIATYTDSFGTAESATARLRGRVYRLNSIFDPRFRGTGPQNSVFGLDVMRQMYGTYRVYFTTIEARYFSRDNWTVSQNAADSMRHWSNGQVLHLEIGRAANVAADTIEWITDSIQAKATQTQTGSLTGGLYEPSSSDMPDQIKKLVENGAQFPGGVKFKRLPDHYLGDDVVAGGSGPVRGAVYRSKKDLMPRIAASVSMRHLSRETDAEYYSSLDWSGDTGGPNDPLETRLVGVGWGNCAEGVSTVAGEKPVAGGHMIVKMKFYCILMAKEAGQGFTVDPEV